jgi:hypothetical protein
VFRKWKIWVITFIENHRVNMLRQIHCYYYYYYNYHHNQYYYYYYDSDCTLHSAVPWVRVKPLPRGSLHSSFWKIHLILMKSDVKILKISAAPRMVDFSSSTLWRLLL